MIWGIDMAKDTRTEPPTLEQATAAFVLALDAARPAEIQKQFKAALGNGQDFALPASQRRIWRELTGLIKAH